MSGHAVVMEAYVHGVSTRSVDDLVEALPLTRCRVGDQQIRGLEDLRRPGRGGGAFRTRPLSHIEFPFVYLDATTSTSAPRRRWRTTGQVTSMAVVVPTGIAADGGREILGLDVGDSEDEVFWRGFLTSLKQRGLAGVKLAISNQHAGLGKALKRSF